ncbi:aspartyl/glutamyl-tRNA amidotransferase subunit C [Candidatus Roizmanbacteria bacterium]|nr:aspartyl/glutamyl-tRNA amidotransferase subunit C [Candidatus Roizmanbacteria bacterium]
MSSSNDLTKEETIHLSHLANLPLSDAEVGQFAKKLGETAEYVNNLKKLPTDNVKGTANTAQIKNVYMEDGEKNERGLTKEDLGLNGKKKENCFVVNRIM